MNVAEKPIEELTIRDLTSQDMLETFAAYRASRGTKPTQLLPMFRALLGFPHIERLYAALAVLPQGTFFLRDKLASILENWEDPNMLDIGDIMVIPARTRAIRVFVNDWIRERSMADKKLWQYAANNAFHQTLSEALKISTAIPDYTDIAFAGVPRRLQMSRAIAFAEPIRLSDWMDAALAFNLDTPVLEVLQGKHCIPVTIYEQGVLYNKVVGA
jgi:hypothetical protein